MENRTFDAICTVVAQHKMSALRAMALSKSKDGFLMSELAQASGFSSTAATQAVDDLERVGYVLRVHQIDDRRTIKVSITTEGKSVLNTMFNSIDNLLKKK